MVSRLVARRDLVSFVRQPAGLWDLCLIGLIITPLLQISIGSPFLLSLLGLTIAWLWTSRRASSILVDAPPVENAAHPKLLVVAGIATSVGWIIAAMVTYGWWASASLVRIDNPTGIVVVASLLGGALVMAILQYSWRMTVALAAMVVMGVTLVWQVSECWIHPDPWPAQGLPSYLRLLILLSAGTLLDTWARPVGKKTRWLSRSMRIFAVAPLVAGLMLFIELAPASLGQEPVLRRAIWLAAWILGLIVVVSLYAGGILRQTPFMHLPKFRPNHPVDPATKEMRLIEVLAAMPPWILLASASTVTWLAVLAAFILARLSAAPWRAKMADQMGSADRSSSPTVNDSALMLGARFTPNRHRAS
jgi:hypothetical protein